MRALKSVWTCAAGEQHRDLIDRKELNLHFGRESSLHPWNGCMVKMNSWKCSVLSFSAPNLTIINHWMLRKHFSNMVRRVCVRGGKKKMMLTMMVKCEDVPEWAQAAESGIKVCSLWGKQRQEGKNSWNSHSSSTAAAKVEKVFFSLFSFEHEPTRKVEQHRREHRSQTVFIIAFFFSVCSLLSSSIANKSFPAPSTGPFMRSSSFRQWPAPAARLSAACREDELEKHWVEVVVFH